MPEESRAPLPPIRLRCLLPSLRDVIFVALLLSFSLGPLSQKLLSDGDIGWHIRNGQQILSTRTLPRTDSFSSTMQGQPWFAWEWLYDAGIGTIYDAASLNGVVAVSALILSCTFLIAFRIMLRNHGNSVIALFLLLFAVSASMIHTLARPHLLSWLLLVIWFSILDTEEREMSDSRVLSRMYWLPLLTILWVNLHGGFVLGFVLLGSYVIGALVSSVRTAASARMHAIRHVKALSLVSALCALGTLVNPYGYRLHIHIFHYLSNRFFMEHINEFKSPDFHGAAERCFLLMLTITSLVLVSRWRSVRPSQMLLAAFAAYAGFRASRNIPISALLFAMISAPLLTGMVSEFSDKRPSTFLRAVAIRLQVISGKLNNAQTQLQGYLWPTIAVLVLVGASLNHGFVGTFRLMNAHFDTHRFPMQAVDDLMEQKITEPVFTQDSWSGYLIYRMYPQTKVVVDDRHDLYGEAFLREYLKVLHVEPGWQSVLDAWKVNLVLMPQKSLLTGALRQDSRWRAIENDEVAVTFRRATPMR
jgi:hypothetical protein